MYELTTPLLLLNETPLHAGSGNDLGVVDLPIQREGHTGIPKIEGSSLKGALREAVEKNNISTSKLNAVFGPPETDANLHAGAIGFTDARLLLFPVKSMKGLFAWITCPRVLRQMQRDFEKAGISVSLPNDLGAIQDGQAFVLSQNNLVERNKIILEEYAFFSSIQSDIGQIGNEALGNWLANHLFPESIPGFSYWQDKLKKDIVILHDDAFSDFASFSTEVITRIRIDEKTGTVANGALWTEEYLPSESILYSMALIGPARANAAAYQDLQKAESVHQYLKTCIPPLVQIGGNATVGKGLTHVRLLSINQTNQPES